ncbi:MAG: protein translocase subunit SecF [Hyphomicrobiales bacterium]|nr:protein translocase subunit SecF [Hyphomicrobiales bacterium]
MMRLRLAPDNLNFSFMRFRHVSYPFSAMLSILSVVLFLSIGLNYGIDFSGGTLLELRAKSGKAELSELRSLGEKLSLGELEVQAFGNGQDVSVRVRLQPGGDEAQQAAVQKLQAAVQDKYEVRRSEVVGPRISGELVQAGTIGVVLSIIAVLIYLWFRFEWQLAIAAVIATMHDLLMTLGFFSITQLEFNITSIAAILTIVGVSLNETVVVLDRIREMMRKYRRMPIDELIDVSINAVLARTIMTTSTTVMALLALVIFGGHVIQSFSYAMMFGILAGVYSSVFICSPILIYLGMRGEMLSSAADTSAVPAE